METWCLNWFIVISFILNMFLPLGMLHLNENHLPIEKIFLNKDGGDINKMKYNKIKHTDFF